MLNAIKNFMKEEDGLTAVEYAIAGGVVTAALVTLLTLVGDRAVVLLTTLLTNMGGEAPAN